MSIKKLILLGFLASMYTYFSHACVIELTNDGNKTLLVVTDDFKKGMILPAKGHVEFGSKKYMANFRVMTQNGNYFTEQYHVQQTACTPNKYAKLTISEITNNSNNLFNISLASPKPLSKKSGCGCGH